MQAMLTVVKPCQAGQEQDVHGWLPSAMRHHSHTPADNLSRSCSCSPQHNPSANLQGTGLYTSYWLSDPRQAWYAACSELPGE